MSIPREIGAPEKFLLEITPRTILVDGKILSTLQGCEDPLGQQDYYCDLFRELLRELVAKKIAFEVTQ